MYNQDNLKPSPAYLKTITIIHAALLMGQVLFGIVSYSIAVNPAVNLKPANDPLFYIVPVVIIAGIFVGTFLFRQQLAKLNDNSSTLKEKLGVYQTALIIRYALSEGPSLLGIVAFFTTGNLFYLLLVGFNVIWFIWIRPTKDKIKEDLSLSYEDEIAMKG